MIWDALGTKETRLPLRRNPDIEHEQMKALIDLEPSQNNSWALSDQADTSFVEKRALRQNPTQVLAVFSCQEKLLLPSASFLAELSVSSPQQIFIYII